jgi:hypothetical protein
LSPPISAFGFTPCWLSREPTAFLS